MALYNNFYSWKSVLGWGTFVGHCKEAHFQKSHCKRFVHITLACMEFLPIISQIVSIFEKLIVSLALRCKKETKEETIQEHDTNTSSVRPVNQQPVGSIGPILATSSEPLTKWDRSQIRKYHETVASSSLPNDRFAWNTWSDSNLMPSMEGLAQIGRELSQHYQFPEGSLAVCPTLTEFKEQLNTIQNTPGDFRKAFVIPTHSSYGGRKQDGTIAKRSEEFVQHIVAVAAERKGTTLHVAILEPMMGKNANINPHQVGLDFKENNMVAFTEKEMILSYIVSSKLDPNTTVLYHSNVSRLKSNGCWVVALKDAVKFLKSPNFFNEIKVENTQSSTKIKKFVLKGIEVLPVTFMKTAQFSEQEFDQYFTSHSDQNSEAIRERIAKHVVKGRNFRVGHAAVKWIEALRLGNPIKS